MKNKLIHLLMAGTLACGAPYALHARTEMADAGPGNPSVEKQLTGSAPTVVTDTRTNIHYLVTEYGIANLKGLATWQRAEAI